jgi:adenosine deaminase
MSNDLLCQAKDAAAAPAPLLLAQAGSPGKAVFATIEAFIEASPKTELHLHTSGSITPEFMLKWGRNIDWNDPKYPKYKEINEISQRYNIDLNQVFKKGDLQTLKKILAFTSEKGDLVDYLSRMNLGHRLLHNNLPLWEELAYDVAVRSFRDSRVTYLELRFPVIKPPLKPDQIIAAVRRGLLRAEKDCPGLKTGMIVSTMKPFPPAVTRQIVDTMAELRGKPEYRQHLVGLDTAGPEYFKNEKDEWVHFSHAAVKESFDLARRSGIRITNHAGEQFRSLEDGLDAIRHSVEMLGAERIGHGLAVGIDPRSLLGTKDHYGMTYDEKRVKLLIEKQEALVKLLISRGVMIEVCLSSNLQTQPGIIPSLAKHPLRRWIERGLMVSLSTDNFVTSNTTLNEEYVRAARTFGLNERHLKIMMTHGFRLQFTR